MACLQWDFSVKAVHLAECLHCESWCVWWVFGVLCESNLSIVTIVLCEPRAQLANSQRDARRRDEGIHQAHHAPTVPTLLAGEVLQRLQTNVSFLAAFVMPTNSVYLRVGRLSNIFILAQVYPILLERPPDFNGVTIVWQLGHWERNRLRPLWIRKAQFQPSKQKLLAKHCVFALFVKSSNLRHNLRLLDHNVVHTGCHKLFEISQIQKNRISHNRQLGSYENRSKLDQLVQAHSVVSRHYARDHRRWLSNASEFIFRLDSASRIGQQARVNADRHNGQSNGH